MNEGQSVLGDANDEPGGTNGADRRDRNDTPVEGARGWTDSGGSAADDGRPTTAIAYVRTSHEGADSEYAQRLRLVRAANALGLVLRDIVEERRPGGISEVAYDRLLTSIEWGECQVVLVERPDRIGRSFKQVDEFIDCVEEAGGRVITVVEMEAVVSGADPMVAAMSGMFELEMSSDDA